MSDLVIHDAEVGGRRLDVVVAGGLIVDLLRPSRRNQAAVVVEAGAGALIPGLHDHHLHLMALAAARRSLTFDRDFVEIARLEHAVAPAGDWLRVVGYHESILGEIDRSWLDAIVADRPVRVQHRTGAMWVLNSAALQAAGIDSADGRLLGADDLIRDRVPAVQLDLGEVGRHLGRFGVTGVSDLTPYHAIGDLQRFASSLRAASFPLRVMVTGGPDIAGDTVPGLPSGPVKLVIGDHALPGIDELVHGFTAARRHGRNVAVHCVTRVALVLALAAWNEVGALPGDRIEHGAVIPIELVPTIRDLGLCVVTQPSFLRERGDEYLTDVDAADTGDLWRCGSLLRAGVAVGGSTDAPYGSADPWQAIVSATERTTRSGGTVGGGERVAAADALAMFLTHAHDPGGPMRTVSIGEVADLCLLHVPLAQALREPRAELVAATFVGGKRLAP